MTAQRKKIHLRNIRGFLRMAKSNKLKSKTMRVLRMNRLISMRTKKIATFLEWKTSRNTKTRMRSSKGATQM